MKHVDCCFDFSRSHRVARVIGAEPCSLLSNSTTGLVRTNRLFDVVALVFGDTIGVNRVRPVQVDCVINNGVRFDRGPFVFDDRVRVDLVVLVFEARVRFDLVPLC